MRSIYFEGLDSIQSKMESSFLSGVADDGPTTEMVKIRRTQREHNESAYPPNVLQNSKVAGRLVFRENTRREAIADSCSLNRITEVAREFNVRR
jgi:hypothetical protein